MVRSAHGQPVYPGLVCWFPAQRKPVREPPRGAEAQGLLPGSHAASPLSCRSVVLGQHRPGSRVQLPGRRQPESLEQRGTLATS